MIGTNERARRHLIWALLALVPGIAFASLFWNRDLDPIAVAPEQHFYIVSVAAAVCFGLSAIAVRYALTTDSPRVCLISLGFLTMAGTFAVHGLATPGFLLDAKYFVVTGFSARIGIWLGALFLAASALPYPPPVASAIVRWRLPLFVLTGAALLGYLFVGLRFPESVPPRIMSASLFLEGTYWTVLAFCAVAVVSYWRLYLRSGAAVYGAIVVGAILMAEAQIAMHFGELWRWSWWMYHLQLLGAFATMLAFPFAAGGVDEAAAPTLAEDQTLASRRAA
jgi:hypothetical protein